MSFKAERTLTIPGVSSTGTEHGLLIEYAHNDFRFTVTGANGKRHASVILADISTIAPVTNFLQEDEQP